MFRQSGSQNAEGGFFNDSTSYSPSVNTDRKKDVARKQQSISSATIKQLLDSPGDSLFIGTQEITLIKVLARVKGINVSSVKTEYLLEDDTGNILGVSWRDGEAADEDAETSPVVENSFCQVIGSLRNVEDKKNLLVLHIAAVNNPNLITEHLLSIMHNRLKSKVVKNQPTGENRTTNGEAVQAGAGGGSEEEQILKFISVTGADEEQGVDKKEVFKAFQGKINNKKIEEVLNFLCTEGQLYTTVDDDHYKSTE